MTKRYETLLSAIDFDSYSKERPLRLLDLGCGLGLLLEYLEANDLPEKVSHFGVDLVDAILTEVRKRWPDQRFDQRDVRDAPYPEGSFDHCIICGFFAVKHGNSFEEALSLAHGTLSAVWPSVTWAWLSTRRQNMLTGNALICSAGRLMTSWPSASKTRADMSHSAWITGCGNLRRSPENSLRLSEDSPVEVLGHCQLTI